MQIRLVIAGRGFSSAAGAPREIELAEGSSLADALAVVQKLPGLPPLPSHCLVALVGEHLGTLARYEPRILREGDELLLIAPVAGGSPRLGGAHPD